MSSGACTPRDGQQHRGGSSRIGMGRSTTPGQQHSSGMDATQQHALLLRAARTTPSALPRFSHTQKSRDQHTTTPMKPSGRPASASQSRLAAHQQPSPVRSGHAATLSTGPPSAATPPASSSSKWKSSDGPMFSVILRGSRQPAPPTKALATVSRCHRVSTSTSGDSSSISLHGSVSTPLSSSHGRHATSSRFTPGHAACADGSSSTRDCTTPVPAAPRPVKSCVASVVRVLSFDDVAECGSDQQQQRRAQDSPFAQHSTSSSSSSSSASCTTARAPSLECAEPLDQVLGLQDAGGCGGSDSTTWLSGGTSQHDLLLLAAGSCTEADGAGAEAAAAAVSGCGGAGGGSRTATAVVPVSTAAAPKPPQAQQTEEDGSTAAGTAAVPAHADAGRKRGVRAVMMRALLALLLVVGALAAAVLCACVVVDAGEEDPYDGAHDMLLPAASTMVIGRRFVV